MVPADRGNVAAAATATAAADKAVQGPISDKNCEKKAPKKIHKAEREKLKRDQLNDLFTELGKMLEADRQNNGKACILSDTTRILRDLLSQVESLQKENNVLQSESNYVTLERNELQDEKNALQKEILELQNELRMRLEGNPIWGHSTTGSSLTVPHPTGAVLPSRQSPHPPVITGTVFPFQQPLQHPTVIEPSYAALPRELQLFPEAAAAEDREPSSQEQEAPNSVMRPQARYPAPEAFWPVNLFPGLPRIEDKQCSSGITNSSKGDSTSTA